MVELAQLMWEGCQKHRQGPELRKGMWGVLGKPPSGQPGVFASLVGPGAEPKKPAEAEVSQARFSPSTLSSLQLLCLVWPEAEQAAWPTFWKGGRLRWAQGFAFCVARVIAAQTRLGLLGATSLVDSAQIGND